MIYNGKKGIKKDLQTGCVVQQGNMRHYRNSWCAVVRAGQAAHENLEQLAMDDNTSIYANNGSENKSNNIVLSTFSIPRGLQQKLLVESGARS